MFRPAVRPPRRLAVLIVATTGLPLALLLWLGWYLLEQDRANEQQQLSRATETAAALLVESLQRAGHQRVNEYIEGRSPRGARETMRAKT